LFLMRLTHYLGIQLNQNITTDLTLIDLFC
jgi:hypothetical protein